MAKAQILVADGDQGFTGALAANLEYLGYAVTEVVSSLEEASKKAAETRPDLVLLDLGLIRNGKKDQALRQLRQLYPQGLLYLVADEDRRALKQAGITHSFHYLRKAYAPRELETIIEMALYRRRFYEEMEASIQHRTQELSQSNAALQNEMAERLWSEKKLKESEERYRLLVDLSPDAIAVFSQERLAFINPAGLRLFGAADPKEMAEKPALDLVHPEHRDAVRLRLRRLAADGGRTKFREIKILRLDGQAVDVEAAGVGVSYLGQPAIQVVLRDITARRRALQDLEHQASFPRLNPNPVLEADYAGNIIYANAASLSALKRLGLENRTRAFLPPDLKEMMRTAAETGETVFQRQLDLGDAVFVESISFPEEFGTIRIYARDITLQKRAEIERQESLSKLQASEEELQASVEELQVQTEELQTQAEELQTAYQNLNEAYTAVDLSNRRLELLAETAGRLLASDSPQEVVESLCRQAMGVFDCDAFFNFLLDDKVRRLRLNAYAGIPEEEARRLEWLELGVAVCGCAARDGCRIVVEDILNTADPRTELVKSHGIQAYACHPLMVEGRVLGTLSFGTRTRPRYTSEELALMSAVADLVAIAMNRKLAEKALRESREDLNRAQAVAHTGSWRIDVLRNELLWSDETYRIFGIPLGTALTYKAFLEKVHPEDREYVDRKWQAALNGEPYDLEHRIVVGDAVKWVRERAELEFDPQGQLLGGFGTVQDITPLKQAEEELKESESRYRSLFQDNHAVMLLIDPESGEIVDANPAACSFYEYTWQELTGKKITDLNLAPRDKVLQNMRKVKAGEESHFFFKHRLAHGEVRDVEVYSSPLKVRGRTLLYSIIHDNTARKEAEETLRTSKDFLEIANRHTQMAPLLQDYAKAVQEHTGCQAVAIRILDANGNIPYQANTGFSKKFLESESNLCIETDRCLCINVVKGATDPDIPCYTKGSSCYINNFTNVLATTPSELLGPTRNVCHHFGYESVALIPIVFREQILGLIHLADCRENMVPLSMVERLERIGLQLGTAINRVRAEEERQRLIRELDTERGRLQAIIESAPEAIVVADKDGKVLMTNPAAERLYSHPGGCVPDAPSCALFQFCHPDGTACVPGDQPLLRSAMEGEIHRDVEMVLAWPDGTRRDLLVNTAPIKDREGRSGGAVGLFQDITQRKRTEDKIRKLNADLSDRVREVSLRTLQLEAANKELEAFSYSVSHDLRTPLRAIEGFARMLVEDYAPKLDGEGLRLLDVIRSNTRIMGHLIDDLLALSRLGRQEIRAQEIDLQPMAAAVFKELQAQEPARRLKLKMNPLPPAFGDRNLLNQVLANLLGNAVKFTQPREMGIIEVGGWTEGKENIYFIKDNGVGFDMRYVDKIFGVFQRLHHREEFEGTGVGLAIVQRIIHRHRGRVWASGKVGEGAEFYFALPVKGE